MRSYKDIDSFIWSTTYERYERNIKKDREDKRLGQWNLHKDKIKNLKYSYVYLKDSGNLIVKKYKIEKFEKSGFDKDFNDPKKWCFIFSKSEDFFVDEWNRTLPNFKAFTVFMIVLYSPFYLLDDNDRFTGFHAFIKGIEKKWLRNIMIISLILLWIALIALADKYFPMQW
ncbi:MAG: hypothetical protein HOE70_02255 [Flavobacteriaceae bacterium]|nr:hypothetical protein [Flavobacteriaceae bacterium]